MAWKSPSDSSLRQLRVRRTFLSHEPGLQSQAEPVEQTSWRQNLIPKRAKSLLITKTVIKSAKNEKVKSNKYAVYHQAMPPHFQPPMTRIKRSSPRKSALLAKKIVHVQWFFTTPIPREPKKLRASPCKAIPINSNAIGRNCYTEKGKTPTYPSVKILTVHPYPFAIQSN